MNKKIPCLVSVTCLGEGSLGPFFPTSSFLCSVSMWSVFFLLFSYILLEVFGHASNYLQSEVVQFKNRFAT